MTPEKYRADYFRQRTRYERLARKIWRNGLHQAARSIPWDRLDPYGYKLQVEIGISLEPIQEAMAKTLYTIGLAYGKRTGRLINQGDDVKQFNAVAFESVFAREVADHIRQNCGKKINSIRQSLAHYVTRTIARGLESGMTIHQITRALKGGLLRNELMAYYQVERIVRTETTHAANFGATRAGKSARVVTVKRWISGIDHRTRRLENDDRFDHADMHLKTVDPDDKFEVPGKRGNDLVEFPGDPKGQAANVINCRCTVAIVPKRDAAGRLIPLGGIRPGPPRPTPPAPPPAPPTPPLPPPRPPRIPKPKPVPPPAPPPAPGTFIPAGSILEAERRMIAAGVKRVSFDGLNAKQYNAILRAVEDENRFAPITLELCEAMGRTRYNSSKGAVMAHWAPLNGSPGVIRWSKSKIASHTKEILVSHEEKLARVKANLERYKRDLKQAEENGFRWSHLQSNRDIQEMETRIAELEGKIARGEPPLYWGISEQMDTLEESIYWTMVHEIGHHRHFYALKQFPMAPRDPRFQFIKNKSPLVTRYSNHNYKEYFAEWYTYWRTGGDESKIPEDLLRLFKQIK